MRRFAKLTRNGSSLYVDPSLVGAVGVSEPGGKTNLLGRGWPPGLLVGDIDESPDEAYRRLAAAAETVTRAEFEAIGEELRQAVLTSGWDLKARMLTATSPKDVVAVVVAPIQAIYDKLKKTTLAALWVAEGEEPPK